jgi:sulfite reductase alpha subunit-like flavoprotein
MKENDIDRTPVAKDIITVCSRCKLELNHIVVRHNAEGIVDRVKCHTCGFEHKYKPVKKKAATTKKRKSPARKKSPEKQYEALMAKNSEVVPVPYSMKASYSEGDIIDHKTFGKGIVIETSFERIEVLFQDGAKTLAADKK